MREIVIKLTIDDDGWSSDIDPEILVYEAIDRGDVNILRVFEVLSDSNEEETLNLDAMMALA